ncbi:hypothetical protein HYFRA_00006993 [Hymenoscyphus fraxineus]|uniref:Uncharacterized protein n=1 Tax=Hymenoscyphus fraxineus TaxID=746836 RepID=A0A9N9PKY8_9HELO|nr:hypothetical protein HYFRA_00006993 [Hymenoscyphus fraxineus]
MSRQSGSSKHRSHHSKHTETNNEDLVEQIKSITTLLYEVASYRPHEWETYVPSARSAMAALDRIHFFRDPKRFAEQVWILQGLQNYAFHDADSGCVRDVAEFCQASWLRILRNFPDNEQVLLGLASNWLQRAQATISQIQREEEEGSDPRRQGPLYVEARGYLQPAVDFYTRAVRAADTAGSTTGDLLSSAAESQMSLGNVTAPPGDERYFHQAIRFLRRAEAMPQYRLSVYMQEYLNDYGRYVS